MAIYTLRFPYDCHLDVCDWLTRTGAVAQEIVLQYLPANHEQELCRVQSATPEWQL